MTTRTRIASTLLLLSLVFGVTAWSQDGSANGNTSYLRSPEHYFQLTFQVRNISPGGRLADTRTYKEIIASGPKSANTSSIRTGDKVPVVTSTGSDLANTQYQYIDIGTNIDARLAETINDSLRLHVTARISSMSTAAPGSARIPIIRETTWDSNVTVPIGKPTIIFSSDNSVDKGRTELELTATQISQP